MSTRPASPLGLRCGASRLSSSLQRITRSLPSRAPKSGISKVRSAFTLEFNSLTTHAGRSLSMMSSSNMHIDPDIPEAHHLRGWYDAAGAEQTYQSHTNATPSGGGVTFDRAEIRSLNDVKTSELGMSDKVDTFSSRATIMHIKGDNIAYPACPSQGCNKKVIQMGDSWRCEKCDKSYPAPEYRYGVVWFPVLNGSFTQDLHLDTSYRWQSPITRVRHGSKVSTMSAWSSSECLQMISSPSGSASDNLCA